MKHGARLTLAAVFACFLTGCQPKVTGPTVTIDLEVVAGGSWTDEEALGIAHQWIRKVLPGGTQIRKREIQLETATPNVIRATIPHGHENDARLFFGFLNDDPTLSFHEVHPDSRTMAPQVEAGETMVPGFAVKLAAEPPSFPYLLKLSPVVSGGIKKAIAFEKQGDWWISVDFDKAGAATMGTYTAAQVGTQLAIVVGDKVLSAPIIQESFSSGAHISGSFTQAEAKALAAILQDPPPVAIKLKSTGAPAPTPAP